MRIAVIGTGYVGLVSGTCFAESGNDVTCVDIDEAKVRALQAGKSPIYEQGLEELLQHNLKVGRLHFTTKLADAAPGADIIFLALPTPPGKDGAADLSAVVKVSEQLGPLLAGYTVIVTKSTVPAGTTEQVHAQVAKATRARFDTVTNPEFLREGQAIEDFNNPDRAVIGTIGPAPRATQLLTELYRPFVGDEQPLYFMDVRSAEITKYASNAFLAMKISFINEIAQLCERLGGNVEAVRQAVGADERIGHSGLFPGIGFGGSCLPKDVQALQKTARDKDYSFRLLEAVITVNDRQKQVLTDKVLRYFNQDVLSKKFALWGLAFKANTDDVRDSPALVIIDTLLQAGATIAAFDPEANDNVRRLYAKQSHLTIVDDPDQALEGADALLIATDWSMFRAADVQKIAAHLKKPVIFDGRNVFDPQLMRAHGLHYESIGRTQPAEEAS